MRDRLKIIRGVTCRLDLKGKMELIRLAISLSVYWVSAHNWAGMAPPRDHMDRCLFWGRWSHVRRRRISSLSSSQRGVMCILLLRMKMSMTRVDGIIVAPLLELQWKRGTRLHLPCTSCVRLPPISLA